MRRTASILVAAAFLGSFAGSALATCPPPGPAGFPKWLQGLKKEAASMGVSPRGLAVLDHIQYDKRVIDRDRSQSTFSLTFLQFQQKLISANRMSKAQGLLKKHAALFSKVQKKYGVPGPVLVAFWGLETDFGSYMGDFKTIQSLATLAYDCRRPEKFRPQVIAALQIIDRGDMSENQMVGAWAGEIGQVQFLPADFLESGVDADGDGRVDLIGSLEDIMFSAANLLVNHGWQANQPWLQEVEVPQDLPWEKADIAIRLPRSQWAKWGVTMRGGKPVKADNVQVSLLLPMGRHGPAFFAYHNFTKVYLKWNESLVYSLTAAYFATRLAGAPPVLPGNGPVDALDYQQIMELQKVLSRKGYDVGEIDGKLGSMTRAAVKDMQIKLGMPADSWPTPDFLAKLKRS
ncbi:MAG: lytic murein transglycosylase [Rhizobiales bacterium]|nr:lytic murein transglycosylase [Hyphomicrobiales bacterium]